MKLTLHRLTVTVAALTLAAGLAACGGDTGTGNSSSASSSAAGGPFRVLAVLPLSGPLTQQATLELNGLKAAADKLNANGGIGGRKIEVTSVDDKLTPTEAVTQLQSALTGSEKPDYVVAGSTSNETLAMLPALSSAKVLSGSVASDLAINDPAKYPYHFGYQSANDQNYAAFIKYAKSKGVKTLGFIAANDALGTYNATAIKQAVEGSGITLVSQSYDNKATDLTAPMDAVRAGKPDMLLASGFGPSAGHILDARAKLNWTVPVVGDSGFAGSNPASLVDASELSDVNIQTFKVAAVASKRDWQPHTQDMIDAVAKQGPVNQIITLASEPYDALQVLATAAKQAGSTDTAGLKKALESLKSPSSVPWTTYAEYGYTAKTHFPVVSAGDFAYLPATALTNGQFQAK